MPVPIGREDGKEADRSRMEAQLLCIWGGRGGLGVSEREEREEGQDG
jgi:hypothetical protein